MLVLIRKKGQAIFIGEDIVIQVIDVKGAQVRLGISAPREITINRAEWHKRETEKREALLPGTDPPVQSQ